MDKENYNPYRTAIKRDYLSKPMKEIVKRNLLKGDILDYACGNGLDSEWLLERLPYSNMEIRQVQ